MPYFKDTLNKLHFLDNASDAAKYLPIGCIAITDAEALILQTPVVIPPTPAQLLTTYQELAKVALTATDTTFARIQEAITLGLVLNTDTVVVAWINYRKALRAEMKATAVGTLPTKPLTYPTGT